MKVLYYALWLLEHKRGSDRRSGLNAPRTGEQTISEAKAQGKQGVNKKRSRKMRALVNVLFSNRCIIAIMQG